MSTDRPTYQNDAYWRDPFTLGHLIYILRVYEELRATNATFAHAVLANSAEAASLFENHRDLMRVSMVLDYAPGKGRVEILCNELDNDNHFTAANVVRLRARVCRAKPCTLEEADALTLDELADVLEAPGKHDKAEGEGDAGKPSKRSRKGKGGKPALPPAEEKKRLDILKDWWQAQEAGVKRKDYCQDKGIPLKTLKRYVNWHGTRKIRDTN